MILSPTPQKLFYLGPKGTFTDMAKNAFSESFSLSDVQKIPVCSISKGFDFLLNTQNSAIVLPIENSIEGIVRETLDNLISLEAHNIKIISEHVISIEQNLVGFASDISEIKSITSHPQAIAQCRKYLNTHFPNTEIKFTNSTANAISALSPSSPSEAAIGSAFCSRLYNIPIIKEKINDEQNNQTRFVLIGTQTLPKARNSKTAITFTTANIPGALNKILSVFERYNINMTQIESRPSKKSLGNYTFFIEIDGHFQDDKIVKALFEVINHTKMFKHLGSYFTV